jgi:hypothetical protein
MAENNPADWREPFLLRGTHVRWALPCVLRAPPCRLAALSGGGRVLLLSAYFGASYLLTLVALLVI